jgi:hypothetical protein
MSRGFTRLGNVYLQLPIWDNLYIRDAIQSASCQLLVTFWGLNMERLAVEYVPVYIGERQCSVVGSHENILGLPSKSIMSRKCRLAEGLLVRNEEKNRSRV